VLLLRVGAMAAAPRIKEILPALSNAKIRAMACDADDDRRRCEWSVGYMVTAALPSTCEPRHPGLAACEAPG